MRGRETEASKAPGEIILSKDNNKCKGPGAGVSVLCLRDSQKARGVPMA